MNKTIAGKRTGPKTSRLDSKLTLLVNHDSALGAQQSMIKRWTTVSQVMTWNVV